MAFKKNKVWIILGLVILTSCTSSDRMTQLKTEDIMQNNSNFIDQRFRIDDVSVNEDNVYPIYFGTTRKAGRVDANHQVPFFTEYRNNKISYGVAKVKVPIHRKRGSTGTFWGNILGNDEYVIPISPYQLYASAEDFVDGVSGVLSSSNNEFIVIYIHGYNNSFEDALVRAAQMAADTEVPKNHMFLFSWPAIKKTTTYTQDEATIDVSEIYFSDFIAQVKKALPNKEIHVVAHSMGNRALLRAISGGVRLAAKKEIKFGQIILAAADVDAELFWQNRNYYIDSSKQTTIYISPYDNALGVSKFVHRYPRLGCGVEPYYKDNKINYIVSTLKSDFPAHAYVAENGHILDDLTSLFNAGEPYRPDHVWNKVDSNYWRIGPVITSRKVRCDELRDE